MYQEAGMYSTKSNFMRADKKEWGESIETQEILKSTEYLSLKVQPKRDGSIN